jgi:hypothetical protein
VGIEVQEIGQLTVTPTAQFERLQSGIQAALLLVQQTVEQQDGRLDVLSGDLQHGGVCHGRQEFHGTARQQLPPLSGRIGCCVQIPAGNDLTRNPPLLGQLMEGVLHFHVQDRSQLLGEVSARRTMNEFLGGGQQGAEAGKPNLRL